MNNVMDIGFWLDLGRRISGAMGNAFRWVFATKGRLQLVIISLIVLALLYGCTRTAQQREARQNTPAASASATPTGTACVQPNALTEAEKKAATLVFQACSVPNYPDTRKAAAARVLTTTSGETTAAPPADETAQRFAQHLPNAVQQIGGADADGNTTVLATSSASKFLLSFNTKGELVKANDITETADATPTKSATGTPAPPASASSTAIPKPTATR